MVISPETLQPREDGEMYYFMQVAPELHPAYPLFSENSRTVDRTTLLAGMIGLAGLSLLPDSQKLNQLLQTTKQQVVSRRNLLIGSSLTLATAAVLMYIAGEGDTKRPDRVGPVISAITPVARPTPEALDPNSRKARAIRLLTNQLPKSELAKPEDQFMIFLQKEIYEAFIPEIAHLGQFDKQSLSDNLTFFKDSEAIVSYIKDLNSELDPSNVEQSATIVFVYNPQTDTFTRKFLLNEATIIQRSKEVQKVVIGQHPQMEVYNSPSYLNRLIAQAVTMHTTVGLMRHALEEPRIIRNLDELHRLKKIYGNILPENSTIYTTGCQLIVVNSGQANVNVNPAARAAYNGYMQFYLTAALASGIEPDPNKLYATFPREYLAAAGVIELLHRNLSIDPWEFKESYKKGLISLFDMYQSKARLKGYDLMDKHCTQILDVINTLQETMFDPTFTTGEPAKKAAEEALKKIDSILLGNQWFDRNPIQDT